MLEQIAARFEQLHRVIPDSLGDLLRLEALDYAQERKEFLLRCRTELWMRNAHGTLHGGMCATIADQAMGSAAYCVKPGEGIAPAIELHVNYHRPLIPGEDVDIRVRIISVTRTLIHTTAELYRRSAPEKICCTACATYFYKPAENAT